MCTTGEYFGTGIFYYEDREVFVDVGAYTGDTIAEFINQCGGYEARALKGAEMVIKNQKLSWRPPLSLAGGLAENT